MPAYYFDSSALVKRYVPEVGSGWVDAATNAASGNTVYIATITAVELIAAFARRGRAGSLSAADVAGASAQLRTDLADEYRGVELTPAVIGRAMQIAETHALRGYDAVQLAAALEVNTVRVAAGEAAAIFVSSDAELNAAATAEGLSVEDPNAHP